jgi:hypothetical protein
MTHHQFLGKSLGTLPISKLEDYHAMLSIVLKGLTDVMDKSNDGFTWKFNNVPGHKNGIQKLLKF